MPSARTHGKGGIGQEAVVQQATQATEAAGSFIIAQGLDSQLSFSKKVNEPMGPLLQTN